MTNEPQSTITINQSTLKKLTSRKIEANIALERGILEIYKDSLPTIGKDGERICLEAKQDIEELTGIIDSQRDELLMIKTRLNDIKMELTEYQMLVTR